MGAPITDPARGPPQGLITQTTIAPAQGIITYTAIAPAQGITHTAIAPALLPTRPLDLARAVACIFTQRCGGPYRSGSCSRFGSNCRVPSTPVPPSQVRCRVVQVADVGPVEARHGLLQMAVVEAVVD